MHDYSCFNSAKNGIRILKLLLGYTTMKSHTLTTLAFAGLSIANLVGCLDLTIVNTALPTIKSSLNLNDLQLQWIMNVVLLALAAFMVMAGKLADRFGKRLMLYVGMILFA